MEPLTMVELGKNKAISKIKNSSFNQGDASEISRANKTRGKRIVLATFGSFGDLHPYMAIALELQKRGHHPAIATSELYRQKIEAEGIEFRAIRPDGSSNLEQNWPFIKLLADCQLETYHTICYELMPHIRATYSDLMDAARGADLLLTHSLVFPASLVAEKTGIPWVSSALSPISLRSVYDSPTLSTLPEGSYERALGLVASDAAMRLYRWKSRFWSAPVRQLRAELGLSPSYDPIFEGFSASKLVLALFSKTLAAPQPDWPTQTCVTGFPFYDRLEDESLPAELEQFLQAGAPPIVFTLGSIAVWTPGNFYTEGIAAAQKLGCRAVLLMGAAARHLRSEELPEGAIAWDYVSHGAIFPRAAAIVHHGGVGTTGQSLRAGRPALVVPHMHDQPDNAARLVSSGVARAIERQNYTADVVAAELDRVLFDPTYGDRAAQLSQIVQSEGGVRTACDAIEPYLCI